MWMMKKFNGSKSVSFEENLGKLKAVNRVKLTTKNKNCDERF